MEEITGGERTLINILVPGKVQSREVKCENKLIWREDNIGQSKRLKCKTQRTSLECRVDMGDELRERR